MWDDDPRRVFPARAGMSPLEEDSTTFRFGFPRTRGDEPEDLHSSHD